MANSPPLPLGFSNPLPAGPGSGPNPATLSMQFPPGTKMEHPLAPFPPELQQQLDQARRAGSYCITVTIHDPAPGDKNRITCYMTRSLSFNRDWLLRMWQTVLSLILRDGLQVPGEVIPPAPPAPAAESNSISA